MNTVPSWYVIYTRPKWEKKVADTLQRRNYEQYCPINKVCRQWHDRKKIIHEPLFTSYVFVRADIRQHSFIREVPGVINLVHWLGKPAVVREEEIEAIKSFLVNYESVQVERTVVSLNDRVKIVGGPLMNLEGNVVEVSTRTVKVTLPSLGFSLTAEVERSNVERLEPHFASESNFGGVYRVVYS